MSNILCPSCKTPAPQGAIFCDNCGYDLRMITAVSEEPLQPTYMVPGGGGGEIICPNCQHPNIAGSAFCENCGTKLTQIAPAARPSPPPSPPPERTPVPESLEETAIGAAAAPKVPESRLDHIPGRLVIPSEKVSIPIPSGVQSVVLGREDPVSGIFPDIDLDPHGGHEAGVGRRHAQLLLQNGQVLVEDLDSVNGTAVNKQKLEPRKPHPIHDGDELRLGKMILTYSSK